VLPGVGPVWSALLPAALYFGVHVLEGEIVTPMLLANRFTINPVAVDPVPDVLVLDVGGSWSDLSGANVSDYQDHLRSTATFRAFGHLLEG
jgi:hypothetical protein